MEKARACNSVGFLMLAYVKYHPQLAGPDFGADYFRKQLPIYLAVNGLYLLGIALAPVAPGVSYAIYGIVVVGLMVFLPKWNMRG